jgi:hypothetical protein
MTDQEQRIGCFFFLQEETARTSSTVYRHTNFTSSCMRVFEVSRSAGACKKVLSLVAGWIPLLITAAANNTCLFVSPAQLNVKNIQKVLLP